MTMLSMRWKRPARLAHLFLAHPPQLSWLLGLEWHRIYFIKFSRGNPCRWEISPFAFCPASISSFQASEPAWPACRPISQPLIPPAWFWQYRCGEVSTILVDRTLIFGSAAFVSGAYQGLEVETVVLGIGGLGMRPKSYLEKLYQETVVASGARQVLISHWDNFFWPIRAELRPFGRAHWTLAHLKPLAERYGQSISVLKYNQPVNMAISP